MNALELLNALELPARCAVNQRVPKSLLAENAATTATDRRLIKEGVERLQWYAALKPAIVGVSRSGDSEHDYQEIAVVGLALRPRAKVTRLIELTHRSIPYPVLLIAEHDTEVLVSLANKRPSRAEPGRTVLEGDVITVVIDQHSDSEQLRSIGGWLAFSRQPRTSVYDLYQGWMDVVVALQVAALTGKFEAARDRQHAANRREALRQCSMLQSEIARLRSAAARTTQLARRAEINIDLQRLNAARAEALAKL